MSATKFIRELVAGDSIWDTNGSILDIIAIHSIKEDSTIFAISFFNQESQENVFNYLHGNIKVELVGA
jgi:hypothetical protein